MSGVEKLLNFISAVNYPTSAFQPSTAEVRHVIVGYKFVSFLMYCMVSRCDVRHDIEYFI